MKLSLILFLVCFQLFAQDSLQPFQSGNFIGLKNETGDVLIPAIYDQIGWSDGAFQPINNTIACKIGEKWGLFEINGKEITPIVYHKLEPLFGNFYKVAVKGKFTNRYFYGVIDEKGKIKTNLGYFDLKLIEQQTILVTKLDGEHFLQGTLNRNFEWTTPIRYKSIRQKESLLIAEKPNGLKDIYSTNGVHLDEGLDDLVERRSHLITNKRGKIGKISWDGSEVLQAVNKTVESNGEVVPFSTWQVDPHSDNFTLQCDSLKRWNLEWLAFTNGFFQLVTSKGKAISQPYQFVDLGKHNIVARANGNRNWYAIDIGGEVVLESQDSIKIEGNYLISKSKNLLAVFDKFGNRVSEKGFEDVKAKNQQFLAVKKHNYWAILDGINDELSPFRYDEVGEIFESLAIAKYINQWGVFHPENGWILQPEFDEITRWNRYFIGRKNQSYYLYDEHGLLKFKTIDSILPTSESLLLFNGFNYGVIGDGGRPLGNVEFKSVKKWGDYYELQKDTKLLLTSNGRQLLKESDEIQDIIGYSEGLFLIKKNDHFGFVDMDGKLRIANRYDSAKLFSEGLAPIKLRGKWGFINQSEQLVIQPHYNEVSSFVNGISFYKYAGRYGFINKSGQEISKPIYSSIQRTTYKNYVIKDKQGRFGFSRQNGIISILPAYEEIHDLGNNRLWTKRDGKVGLLDYSGRQLLNFEYDGIQSINSHLLLRKN